MNDFPGQQYFVFDEKNKPIVLAVPSTEEMMELIKELEKGVAQ